jgi:hypothetical protein
MKIRCKVTHFQDVRNVGPDHEGKIRDGISRQIFAVAMIDEKKEHWTSFELPEFLHRHLEPQVQGSDLSIVGTEFFIEAGQDQSPVASWQRPMKSDVMDRETWPGGCSLRYRLISMDKAENNLITHTPIAVVEDINAEGESDFPSRCIDSTLLPHTFREQLAYLDHGSGNERHEPGDTPESLPVEFEITIRRVEPTKRPPSLT